MRFLLFRKCLVPLPGHLEFLHKGPVDPVLQIPGKPAFPDKIALRDDGPVITHIEDEHEVPLRLKGSELASAQGGKNVPVQDHVLPYCVHADLCQGPGLKADGVAASEDLRMARALKKTVYEQAPIGPHGKSRVFEDYGGGDSGCNEDDISAHMLAARQG